jgi:hypothetical protein
MGHYRRFGCWRQPFACPLGPKSDQGGERRISKSSIKMTRSTASAKAPAVWRCWRLCAVLRLASVDSSPSADLAHPQNGRKRAFGRCRRAPQKQACAFNSSTDHGGGKRRGFTAGGIRPSPVSARGVARLPRRPRCRRLLPSRPARRRSARSGYCGVRPASAGSSSPDNRR